MTLGGYANRIARVNLTHSKVDYEQPNEEDLKKYIGGRGLGVKYVLDNGPKVEPFSEDNILCFLTGMTLMTFWFSLTHLRHARRFV